MNPSAAVVTVRLCVCPSIPFSRQIHEIAVGILLLEMLFVIVPIVIKVRVR